MNRSFRCPRPTPPKSKLKEQRKAKMNGGGASTTSSGRGIDPAPSATNGGEGEPRDDYAIAATAPASPGTAAAVAAPSATASVATTADRGGAQRSSRPYEALLAGSLEKFEGGHHRHGGGDGGGSGGAMAQTSGGNPKRGARDGRPLSSGGKPRFNTIGGRGKDPEREESWRQKEQQTRAKARPKTAGAGSGGVQGVLARMGGYEKVSGWLESDSGSRKKERVERLRRRGGMNDWWPPIFFVWEGIVVSGV